MVYLYDFICIYTLLMDAHQLIVLLHVCQFPFERTSTEKRNQLYALR